MVVVLENALEEREGFVHSNEVVHLLVQLKFGVCVCGNVKPIASGESVGWSSSTAEVAVV